MSYPRRNSRKGLVDRIGRMWRDASRDWRPMRGDWQPSPAQCAILKRHLAGLRATLDELDEKL